MAKVLVVSSNTQFAFDVWRHSTTFLLKHSAKLNKFGQHTLTDDPVEADLILFGEMGSCGGFAEMVRAHPYYRRFAKKCFIFENAYRAVPILPGLYSSLTKEQYRLGYTRTGFYLYLIQNPFLTPRPCSGKEQYLASFVGSSNTHPVREKLFEFGRSDIYTKDTSAYSQRTTFHGSPAEREKFWAEYADSIANAKFSLCPRGLGAGSIRLFESMKMGRACVILSDEWQPNDGVPWNEFAIFVPEKEVHRVPEILDRHERRAVEMGAAARRAWEERFSEQACFHYVVEQCLDIQKHAGNGGWSRKVRMLRQAKPRNLRQYLSSKRNLYRNTGKIYW
jgi:hypothetical protein